MVPRLTGTEKSPSMPSEALRMPAVFFGHGSPMNTLESNRHTMAWGQFGQRAPRPRGILCVSAHWYIRGTAVTAMLQPRTIHDFGGFPKALFEVQYPAPGDPALASRVRDLLAPTEVIEDTSQWGLDHGTWSVLKRVYPKADVPVVQLAILLDTSNSMDGLIAQAKTQLWNIVNEFATAKQDGKAPRVQVALYQYGNNGLSKEKGWVQQVLPLTDDLDKLSEQLFALKTNGGKEYCGADFGFIPEGL
jgi:hypothetical protein